MKTPEGKRKEIKRGMIMETASALFLLTALGTINVASPFATPSIHNRYPSERRQAGVQSTPLFTASTISLPSDLTEATTVTTTTVNTNKPEENDIVSLNEDAWYQEFEVLRSSSLDREELEPFFQNRPQVITKRLLQVTRTLYRARKDWQKNQNATQLCQAVSSLGPLAVKVGQTLSQRPDLVGKEAADALKTLQTKNVPFDNHQAYSVLHQSLNYWDGPLAANLLEDSDYYDTNTHVNSQGPPMFESISPDPLAAASLGQVYKARMHNGQEVAIKVQRPDALAILAMDAQCFRLVWQWKETLDNRKEQTESFWKRVLHKQDTADETNPIPGQTEQQVRAELGADSTSTVAAVLDRVAMDVKKELDYRIEAENGRRFEDSLAFLGFVTTPTVVQATDRVLISEWINGKHLSDIDNKEDALALTQMAAQACTASMVLTGFVHADPHEGNVMLHEDGRVVFLDFGLMSDVAPDKMEGFASGIQALVSENWTALSEAFIDIGFVTDPIRHRNSLQDLWRVDPRFGLPELAQDLEAAMTSTSGGVSRFGALATVLNKKISPNWLVFMPPFVLLLVRTFLTLEGMAATVDPNYNIYEMAMPWAIKRTLSPSTEKGIEVFRSTLLTEENKIQWERLVELASKGSEEVDTTVMQEAETTKPSEKASERAKKVAMNDAINSLLGTSDGKALRRAIKDLDSVDLMDKLSLRENRFLLRQASLAFLDKFGKKKKGQRSGVEPAAGLETKPVNRSPLFNSLQAKQQKWRKQTIRVLLLGHLQKCLLQWRGLKSTLRLLVVSMKVFLSTWWQRRQDEQRRKQGLFAPVASS